MIQFVTLFFLTIFALSKTPKRLVAENVVLRHQVSVLRRKHPDRVRLSRPDRIFLAWLARLYPSVIDAIVTVKPETVLRWHRYGFRALWRWKSRNLGGRPVINREIRELIKTMVRKNPLWGAPRIHGELLKLGFDVSQSTVSKYLSRIYRPSGQSWKTFIQNHKDAIAAVDLFVVPSVSFKLLYGIAILHLGRRKLVWTNANCHPTAERIIGSIRRECLDHTLIFGEAHLRRTLKNYAQYYNRARTHLSLSKDSPIPRPVEHKGDIAKRQHLGGLHHEYRRMR